MLAVILAGVFVAAVVVLRSPTTFARLMPATAPTAMASNVPASTGLAGRIGMLVTKNSSGRSGVFFLPAGYDHAPTPLLVAIHGTGSNGQQIASVFRDAAERQKFIIVAPDSRQRTDGVFTWEVGDQPGEITEDFQHIGACVGEVLSMPGVRMDPAHVLIAGQSGGASTAPYVATNAEPYTAFAVLHGGVFPGGLGNRAVRGWFSTGRADALRSPLGVHDAADSVRGRGPREVVYREFAGGHEIGSVEAADLLAWWLGG